MPDMDINHNALKVELVKVGFGTGKVTYFDLLAASTAQLKAANSSAFLEVSELQALQPKQLSLAS